MRRERKRGTARIVAAIVMTATAAGLPAAASTEPADSGGVFRPPYNIYGTGINAHGVVVGSRAGASNNAFRWDTDETCRDLPALPGANRAKAWVAGINAAGEAVGHSRGHAVRWAADGTVTDLDTLHNELTSRAAAINDNGVIVGVSETADSREHAARWNPDGTAIKLPSLPGDEASAATAVNLDGVIVGTSGKHAVRWDINGTVTALPALAGQTQSAAYGINNDGVIVGTSGKHAVRWAPDGTITRLKKVPGQRVSTATAVNGDGVIVGWSAESDDSSSGDSAVRWGSDGSITVLSPGTHDQAEAAGINDAGVIIGSSRVARPYHDWRPRRWNTDGTSTVVYCYAR
jgi:probable HAF family extracellular repeat protein